MVEDIDPVAYKRAFRETPNPSILAGPDFVIRDVNDACLRFTGYERDELVGETPDVLFTDPAVFFGEVAPALAVENPWLGSFELKAKDDRFRYGYGAATPLFDDDGIIAYAGVFIDITRERRAEQTTRILNRVLRHNLRNDANVILGHLDLLREQAEDEAMEESVAIVEARINRLLDRAETARELEDLISVDSDPQVEPIRVDELLRDAVETARDQYESVEFVVDELVPASVAAGPALATAFDAVLENAVEHNDSDVPRVVVGMEPDDRTVRVTIADNGPGIKQEDLPHVFSLDERSQIYHGEGIDLFFVYELLAEYSGRISVEANDPRGAVFTFHLRRQSDDEEE
ncbi:PAS domain S-box-containing protein [Halogranum gelatinilyticum]|uniref:histidine kinase n=1 Tax=Halogranum gelatinilyticum TaxID=660521 RepID=A0A1G9WDD5_9EURY|nr:PAS domain-containing sensor histidine kinase [Halogranum gelatinilyticum]SDM82509.1 PAS domain S-box-containing protein [Halogranum gelatinilyticum]